MRKGQTRAQANKEIRAEALREQLSQQGHLQYVNENIQKIEDLDSEIDAAEINRLKIASELRLKLANKYIPDLKQSDNYNFNENVSLDKPVKELSDEELEQIAGSNITPVSSAS